MKKILSKRILAGALFTFCLALGGIPVHASEMDQVATEAELIKSNEEETTETALVEIIEEIPVEAIGDGGEEIVPVEFSRANVAAFDLTEQRFIDFFPDENLAKAVAKLFKRTSTDMVTQEELNTLTSANLGNSAISDITGIDSMSNLQKLYLNHNNITEIPSSIGNLSNLHTLHLHNNQITETSFVIDNLPNLQVLYLYSNKFTKTPSSIGNLSNLLTLYLNDNQITEIHSSIGNLSNLQNLYLHDNKITEVPSSIGNLSNLQNLYLQNNNITKIHSYIGKLKNLTYLNLSNNKIMELPSSIANLERLSHLLLTNNLITKIPSFIGGLTSLTSLYLSDNQITELSSSLSSLKRLNTLELNNNQITEIPTSINDLTGLGYLRLDSNRITEFPSSINGLTKLVSLSLKNNQITEIPFSIGNLTGLIGLHLTNNQIKKVSPSIGDLINLSTINLDRNQITELPSSIGNLKKLTSLNLSQNKLTELPSTIGNLTALQALYVDKNKITEIPSSICNLSSLYTLKLEYNEITELSSEVLNFLTATLKMDLLRQSAILNPITISKGSKIEYTNLIPSFIQQTQELNGGVLKGVWAIDTPDESFIVFYDNLEDAMSKFVFEEEGKYTVEYYVDASKSYIINGRKLNNLKYTTTVLVGEQTTDPEPETFYLDTSLSANTISKTEEYKLALSGFIETEVLEGSNILSSDQIKKQFISITVVNLKTGERLFINQDTIDSIEIVVEDGIATHAIISGSVQTAKGNPDTYTTTAHLQ